MKRQARDATLTGARFEDEDDDEDENDFLLPIARLNCVTVLQEPTHILIGVIIQKSFDGSKHPKLALGLTAGIAFLSHGFLDKLANLTYHPPRPDFHSPVWIGYHSFIVVATVGFLVLWWRRFKWGIIFACLPDIDWIFLHGRELFNDLFHTQIHFYPRPYIHNFVGYIWEHIPPFSFITPFLDQLPNLRQNPWACVFEFVLVGGLLLVLKLISMGKRPKVRSLEPTVHSPQ